jgi:hypothetical protein
MAGPKDTLQQLPSEAVIRQELERNLRERAVLRSLLKLADDCRTVLHLCETVQREREVSNA